MIASLNYLLPGKWLSQARIPMEVAPWSSLLPTYDVRCIDHIHILTEAVVLMLVTSVE
jgi:hypothetical protein